MERNINKPNGLGTILICRLRFLLDNNAKKCLKIASNVSKICVGALTTKLLGDSWQLFLVLLLLLFGIRSFLRGFVRWLDYLFILWGAQHCRDLAGILGWRRYRTVLGRSFKGMWPYLLHEVLKGHPEDALFRPMGHEFEPQLRGPQGGRVRPVSSPGKPAPWITKTDKSMKN